MSSMGGATGSNVEVYNGILALEQLVLKPGMLAGLTWLANCVLRWGYARRVAYHPSGLSHVADRHPRNRGHRRRSQGHHDQAPLQRPYAPKPLPPLPGPRAEVKCHRDRRQRHAASAGPERWRILPPLMKVVPPMGQAAIGGTHIAGWRGGTSLPGAPKHKTQGTLSPKRLTEVPGLS